jgi:hypothetical protein
MGLSSVPPVFLRYRNNREFARNAFWIRSDKLAAIPAPLYGTIPVGDEYVIE